MTRRYVWLGVTAVLISIGGCARDGESPPGAAPPVQVRVVAARQGEVADTITAPGETAALTVARLASPVDGRVTYLQVRPGDALAAGAVAARVLPLESEAALHGFRMLSAAGLHPPEQALVDRLQRRAAVQDIPLHAPFAAIVAQRLHNPDEQVARGEVLLELFEPASLYVTAHVPFDAAARIRPGLEVEVTQNGGQLPGRLDAVLPALLPQALTVPLRVRVLAPPPSPLLNAPVECRIVVARHAKAILIPRAALVSSLVEAQATVLVAEDGHARQRTVQLGVRTPAEVEVTAGLSAGELVLVQGQYGLADGAAINAAPEAQP